MGLLCTLSPLLVLLLLVPPMRCFLSRPLPLRLAARTVVPRSIRALSEQPTHTQTITPRGEDYAAWFNDLLSAAELVDHSPVRGCMVIRPWAMGMWDAIRNELDARIRETDTQNAYFPLFIPKSFLAKEAQHVDGFAKECALVTHHRLCASPDGKDLIPDPKAELEEPLVVRPTSETMIWNMFGKWINSHRDLPLKINQWANVVRWEMRTRPFLRTSEFLWQEGHTAHASSEEAITFTKEILDMYADFCEDFLAIPVVKGEKSPSERFAGAERTYTIEALMQNGWALQSGTAHYLGQNFARAFDVTFQTEKGSRELVFATSWGVSTRLIGALLMTHSDDKGVVLPPRVSPVQVVLVPILTGKAEKDSGVLGVCKEMCEKLKRLGVRVKVDDRPALRHGAKYYEWERKGVPLRVEIGPRDVEKGQCVLAVRRSGDKQVLPLSDADSLINSALHSVQSDMLNAAKERLVSKTVQVNSYEQMKTLLGNKDSTGFFIAPWKCDTANEAAIKEDCKATVRCYPYEHNSSPPPPGTKCFYSGEPATHFALFARAF